MRIAPTPTLLVFTLGATQESERRRLLPRRWRRREIELRRACLDAALAAGREAGCRLLVSSPHPLAMPTDAERAEQKGSGFASRLQGALGTAFERGTGPVVLVGSDVPDLTGRHVQEALRQVGEGPERVVIGPSPDGGIYLLASSRPLGDIASKVRWCGAHVLEDLRRALLAAGKEVILLEPLADLDRPADLAHWLATASRRRASREVGRRWRVLRSSLRRLLAALTRPFTAPVLGSVRVFAVVTVPPRAPPVTRQR